MERLTSNGFALLLHPPVQSSVPGGSAFGSLPHRVRAAARRGGEGGYISRGFVRPGYTGERSGNQCLVRLQKAHTESMTGTSTNTPTTVARAAPEPAP